MFIKTQKFIKDAFHKGLMNVLKFQFTLNVVN